ncbi:glycosyl hydrolase family protein (plasmid) [Leisingera sp. NJS201]|uniref:family 16 glycosylhydrolase n=1 Tax=Leisingera sp. NJS201 TaxID=2508306 RepID=UPI001071496D|nr:family 16 glycosylhydrolase [Leisingera sp. NJS201]QBR38585.1 glycosyl hydrolase family protein [Leisingera sp. NJS201]
MLNETFDQLDESERWYISDFAVAASWNHTAWDAEYLLTPPGEAVLTLDGTDTEGKDFTGSELQSQDFYGYGSYEVEMTASDVSGVVSSFFLFSNTFFGAARHNEIDFEFLGNDTTKVNINYYYGNQKLGDNGSVQVDLGFDAAAGMHSYRIEWHPDGIRWYADGTLLYEVTGETAPLPVPDEPMKIYMNIWTGGAGLENWHGPVAPDAEAEASYTSVTYTPMCPKLPPIPAARSPLPARTRLMWSILRTTVFPAPPGSWRLATRSLLGMSMPMTPAKCPKNGTATDRICLPTSPPAAAG